MNRTISLITDFGDKDGYSGIMKGVILSINPDVNIVDITHQIMPQDIFQAAFVLNYSYPYFPEGTIHVVVVDPGVGGQRSIIALKTPTSFFVGPDNGVFTLILEQEKNISGVYLENRKLFLPKVSQTFHGRDIMAPIAGHLSLGVPITELGSALKPEKIKRISLPGVESSVTGQVTGSVISIDRFGNLITNINEKMLKTFLKPFDPDRLKIYAGNLCITGLSSSYDSVNKGEPLAIMGSHGMVEISVCCASAQSCFSMDKGEIVKVEKY